MGQAGVSVNVDSASVGPAVAQPVRHPSQEFSGWRGEPGRVHDARDAAHG